MRYLDILPIRASAYIISILDERIGKGAIGYYLHRRDGVPGWQVGSSMLFIMFCEIFYLLSWATLGVALRGERLPPVFHVIPWIALGAAAFLVVWVLYFRGVIAPGSTLRDRQIFHAFRRANLWHYAAFIVLRSPAMIAGVVVYTLALRLFGVPAELLDMLAFVPVVFFGAAVPGPFRAVAITLWTLPLPREPRPDGGLRPGAAQLLRLLQRGDRAALPAPDEPRARASRRSRSLIESRVEATSAQPSARTSPAPGQPRPSASRTTGIATIT